MDLVHQPKVVSLFTPCSNPTSRLLRPVVHLPPNPPPNLSRTHIDLKSCGTVLKYHPDIDKAQRMFSCPECDMTFRSEMVFNSHVKHVHILVSVYKCSKCKSSFANKDLHDRHECGQ